MGELYQITTFHAFSHPTSPTSLSLPPPVFRCWHSTYRNKLPKPTAKNIKRIGIYWSFCPLTLHPSREYLRITLSYHRILQNAVVAQIRTISLVMFRDSLICVNAANNTAPLGRLARLCLPRRRPVCIWDSRSLRRRKRRERSWILHPCGHILHRQDRSNL